MREISRSSGKDFNTLLKTLHVIVGLRQVLHYTNIGEIRECMNKSNLLRNHSCIFSCRSFRIISSPPRSRSFSCRSFLVISSPSRFRNPVRTIVSHLPYHCPCTNCQFTNCQLCWELGPPHNHNLSTHTMWTTRLPHHELQTEGGFTRAGTCIPFPSTISLKIASKPFIVSDRS